MVFPLYNALAVVGLGKNNNTHLIRLVRYMDTKFPGLMCSHGVRTGT